MSPKTRAWLDHLSLSIYARANKDHAPEYKVREWIAAQLALAYQEGVCDGLRQSEAAIKAAFDKYQGRVEP